MPPAWGCWRAGRAPWPAHATWPAWRLWARTSQTFAPAAMSARCLSRRSRTGGCRWGVWRQRRGGCHGATERTEGTHIQGQASRHPAMSDGSMPQAVERLREASAAWVTHAPQQDKADDAARGRRRGDALPAALARREERGARSAAAMRRLEAPAKAAAP